MKINTDPKIIDEILERGISTIYPTKEELKKVLLSGKKLKIYLGADATGPNLHIGHSTNFILLEKLRKLGHEVVVLFGDFTAMIGDPTDKNAERVPLTPKQVKENIKTWKKQLVPIVNFKKFSDNRAKIVKNSKWLSKLNLADMIKLSKNFTVGQMIERDMFQKRLKEGKPISLVEFIYPILQGYDSVVLDVDLEIGGTDQTFNMLVGRTLQKKFRNKEKFVITTTLLENPKTGKKLMSKSEGNFIGLMDSPEDMFGKTMALPDETIVSVLNDCTFVGMYKIENIKKELAEGKNPKEVKMFLAEELIKIYHGEKEAIKAKENFQATFSKKEIPENIPEVTALANELLSEILLKQNIISSKSDFARLIKEGAITELEGGKKITDLKESAKSGTYKIGKHRFIRIVGSK